MVTPCGPPNEPLSPGAGVAGGPPPAMVEIRYDCAAAVVLNTILSEALDQLCEGLEEKLRTGMEFEPALKEVLVAALKESRAIVFNGDGYSDEWIEEAGRRGLLSCKTTPDALPHLIEEKNITLFEKYKVLSSKEVHSRLEIWLEQYVSTVTIEVDTTEAIAKTMVYPAVTRYINELAAAAKSTKELGIDSSGTIHMLETVTEALNKLDRALINLADVQAGLHADSMAELALEYKDQVIPAMTEIRNAVDFLERYTADDYWPLPVYREMLFIQ